MTVRLFLTLAACAAVGVLQVWGCVSLLGILAAFSSRQAFFGLSIHVVMALDMLVAWVPLSLLVGLLIGLLLKQHALALSGFTAACAFLWLALTGSDFWWGIGSLEQMMKAMAFLFLSAGIFLLSATPCGALIARRLQRRPSP